jgi:transcriptional regulator with PAS, ATPase and Fis domain
MSKILDNITDSYMTVSDDNHKMTDETLNKLREREEKYRTLFETMTLGVVYQDASGRITSANPAAQKILGLTLDQMQGRKSIDPRWKAVHEDGSDFPGDTHPAMVALKTGKPVRNVIMGVYNPPLNDHCWINITAMPLFREGEKTPFQVYATFEDITQQKKSQEEINLLRTILPICASCKNIRDDKGYWRKVEEYINEHTGIDFTHGICPKCVEKLYPQIKKEDSE